MIKAIAIIMFSLGLVQTVNGNDELDDCQKMNGGSGPIWNKGLVMDLQEDCLTIDCNHVTYSANYSRTILIMKFCTGGEKEVQ